MEEGRANPRQLYLTPETLDSFKAMVENIKKTALETSGFEPVVICQLTHSGRYSKPTGTPAPLIAYNNPLFEKDTPIAPNRILSDDYLKKLEETFGKAAALAEAAGFDGARILNAAIAICCVKRFPAIRGPGAMAVRSKTAPASI